MATLYSTLLGSDQKPTAQHDSGILPIPNEILVHIAKDLLKHDIASLRQACKHFRAMYTPLLFNTVLLVSNARKLEDAKQITLTFPEHIRTIYISPIDYPLMTEKRYGNVVDQDSRGSKALQDHLALGYQTYCKLRKEHQEITASREISMVLCHILDRVSNNIRVVAKIPPRLKRIRAEERREYCPGNGCKLSVARHSALRPSPTATSDCGASFMPSLMLALSNATPHVNEIIVGPGSWQMKGIPATSFRMSARQIKNLSTITSKLTKLALTLQFVSENDKRVATDGTIATVLASATNLESLCLEMTTEYVYGHRYRVGFVRIALLQECRFPILKKLLLSEVETHLEDLTSFLSGLPHLESLGLHCHHLISGKWFFLVQFIRDHLNLEKLFIHSPYQHIANQDHPYPIFKEDHGLVENYLFRGGENPFQEDVAQHLALTRGGGGSDFGEWFCSEIYDEGH